MKKDVPVLVLMRMGLYSLILPDFESKALVLTNFVLCAHDKRCILILELTTRETCTHTHNIVLTLITLLPQEPTSR